MKIGMVVKSAVSFVVGAVFVTALASAADMPREKQPVKDSWLTSKTKIALFADDRVHGRDVNVETKQGTVILRGKVDTPEAKGAAEEIAKGIDGVASVKNDLQVVKPSKKKDVEVTDDAITKQVKRQMARDKDLKHESVDVKVNAGVVSLTGEANTFSSSAKASYIAWKTPGVKSVKNDITVKEQSS